MLTSVSSNDDAAATSADGGAVVTLKARNATHTFPILPNTSLLLAGLAAGLDLPYECATGTCGSCKMRRVAGEVVDGWRDAPGRKYCKHADDILLCQCSASASVGVEISRNIGALAPAVKPPTVGAGRIAHSRMLAPDVIAFDVVLDAPMRFDAGQFALVRVPRIPGYRAWSMVNYAKSARSLEFVVKKKPGGAASAWLFDLSAIDGSTVDVIGPLGRATWTPDVDRNLLLIAGGSGIAGMISILQHALEAGHFRRRRGWLFFGVRTYADAFYLDRLATLAAQAGPNLAITIALSDAAAPPEAAQRHPALAYAAGFVHEVARDAMLARFDELRDNVRAYLAGPPPAVDAAMRVLLMEAKLPATELRFDKFS